MALEMAFFMALEAAEPFERNDPERVLRDGKGVTRTFIPLEPERQRISRPGAPGWTS
jgi:hypothetical protein